MPDNLSFEEKQVILRDVIEKIVIKDNEVSIYGIIPLHEEDSIESDNVLVASRES